MRNMRSRRTAVTRSTTVTRLYAVGTAEHGSESVTVTPQSTRSVRSARRRDCCGRWRKYTISCRWQRAAPTMRATLCRCASPAMQGFMRSAVTDGIKNETVFTQSQNGTGRYRTYTALGKCLTNSPSSLDRSARRFQPTYCLSYHYPPLILLDSKKKKVSGKN